MELRNKRVLVTGSDGFVGSHIVERLVKKGAVVKAFVYYNSFNSWGWLETLPKNILKKVEIYTGDIRDPNGVLAAMKDVDAVFHLAALVGVPFSYRSPDSYVDTNIKGTLNILQAARRLKIRKMLQTSTSEVYGKAQYMPMDEGHPIDPQSPYAATKSAADQIALSFHRSFKTPVTLVRPFSIYGPRQSARAIIPTIISQVCANTKTIKLGNTEATRDFTYVTDIADAYIKIAEHNKTSGKVYHVCNSKEISIGDIVLEVSKIAGKEIKIVHDKKRLRPGKNEVTRLKGNNEKIRKEVGWKPKVSLKEGLRNTYSWVKKNISSFKTDIYNV